MNRNTRPGPFQQGFTLIEIAIGLLIIGLFVGGTLSFNKNVSDTEKNQRQKVIMKDVQALLDTYVLVNGFLPCPDQFTDGDGFEDRSSNGSCKSRRGYLPVVTLGDDVVDAWGQPFLYRVNARSENKDKIVNICESASVFGREGTLIKPSGFGYCSSNNNYYCDDCTDACPGVCNFSPTVGNESAPPYFHMATRPVSAEGSTYKNLVVEDEADNLVDELAVAVVVSFADNGIRTWGYMNENAFNCDGLNELTADEKENCDNDVTFKYFETDYQPDQLVWINLDELKKKMLVAGRFSE